MIETNEPTEGTVVKQEKVRKLPFNFVDDTVDPNQTSITEATLETFDEFEEVEEVEEENNEFEY